jgi:HTH-type transcriptional regulator/antitoxin MqsA
MITCYACGAECPLVTEMREIRIGRRVAQVEDVFYRCPACEEEFYLGGMGDDTLRRAAAEIRAKDGLLSPDEIVAVRKNYGLTQAAMERLIGAGKKTVVRWERGTIPQSRTADTLLRVLRDHPDVVAALAEERGVRLRAVRRAA